MKSTLQGKGENSVVHYSLFAKQLKPREGRKETFRNTRVLRAPIFCANEFFPMKRFQERSSLNCFFEGESKRMLSRLATPRSCGT